jgi:predicted naringenin-chalcone synthase
MAWEIGNHGYEIVLSSYVPSILGDILRRHGNWSSATMFFLLKEADFDGPTAAMAFGPGLTVEMAFLQPVHGDSP